MPVHKDGDAVNHPPHYNDHPAGIECIEVVRHMPFNIGSAIKYLWRAGKKENAPTEQDYDKAVWYILDEKERLFPKPEKSVKYIEFPIHKNREERPGVQVVITDAAWECHWCKHVIMKGFRMKIYDKMYFHPFCLNRYFEKNDTELEAGIEL